MKQRPRNKTPVGKLIAIAVILLACAAIMKPTLLFFLTPAQQQVLADFQQTYFTNLMPVSGPEGGFDWLRIVALILLIGECWVVNTLVALVAKKWKLKNRHAETLKGLACNCVKYAVVIFAVIFGLSILGVNMVAVLTSLGIVGLVVGFGAQSLIEDVITGLFIIFEGQFRVGDIISIDNFRGTVTGIGIRTTDLMDAGGNIKIINNSDIRTLTNLSEVESFAVADVGIAYNADLLTAERVISELMGEIPGMYPEIFREPPSYSGVQSLSASSVELRVVAKVDEANVYIARRLLNRELKLRLDREKIEIPFPQLTVHRES
ncbi:MAG: mechanosensitive ion channel family protein [Oscillospiraceae bacterium]